MEDREERYWSDVQYIEQHRERFFQRPEDKRRQKARFDLFARLLSENVQDPVTLSEELWGTLPEEILWNIFVRLSLAVQCQLRCLCREWERVLPVSLLDCPRTDTFWSGDVDEKHVFYCHGENKWYTLPFQPRRDMKPSDEWWFSEASNGGLLFFVKGDQTDESDENGERLLCNPMTGSNLKFIMKGEYNHLELTILLVNLEAKTFQVVFMKRDATVVYDSQTRECEYLQGVGQALPDLPEPPRLYDSAFGWKDKIYGRVGESGSYFEFDLKSNTWTIRDMAFPNGCDITEKYYLASWKERAMLVQLHLTQKDPIRIWMLRDGPSERPFIWEKISVKIPEAMRTSEVLPALRHCTSFDHESVRFSTEWGNQWVKYTFWSKSWQVMPQPEHISDHGQLNGTIKWGNFEPQIVLNPGAADCIIDGPRR